MALFPGPDSPAYRAWSAAADVVILNVLTLAGCLPVVTAGASLTACARVAGEMAADGDPAVVTTWWRSFRLNLSQSLTWWLPVLVLVTLGGWEYLVLAGSSPEDQHGTVSGALSGVVLALLGLGMDAFDACCCAVWLHGRAGDLAAQEKGQWGMTPTDLLERLPQALREVTE